MILVDSNVYRYCFKIQNIIAFARTWVCLRMFKLIAVRYRLQSSMPFLRAITLDYMECH